MVLQMFLSARLSLEQAIYLIFYLFLLSRTSKQKNDVKNFESLTSSVQIRSRLFDFWYQTPLSSPARSNKPGSWRAVYHPKKKLTSALRSQCISSGCEVSGNFRLDSLVLCFLNPVLCSIGLQTPIRAFWHPCEE